MKLSSYLLIFFLMTTFVIANPGHEEEFSGAQKIISEQIPCDQLNESDLELLGEYYMELMHPGEAHMVMDDHMGGEGSESLKQLHINMGTRFYCNEETTIGNNKEYGTMGMMGGYFWSHSGVGITLQVILIVMLVVGIVVFVSWLAKRNSKLNFDNILKKRYARGDISKKEFENLKNEILENKQ